MCPFVSLSSLSICVHHLLLTGTLTYILKSVVWQFKFLPSCDAIILHMISEVAKEEKTEYEQGFRVSPVHADMIAHISLTRTKSYGPNNWNRVSLWTQEIKKWDLSSTALLVAQVEMYNRQMEMWMLTQKDNIKDKSEKLGGYLTLCQTTDNITILQLSWVLNFSPFLFLY